MRAQLARLRESAPLHRPVVVNAASMAGATAITSLLGAAFWVVGARSLPEDVIGIAAAAVAAMMLLGFLATLGLGTMLMGELPRQGERRRGLLGAALLASGVAGIALGVGFALAAPLLTDELSLLRSSPLALAVFALGVALTAATFVLDQALIGLLRGGLQLTRNIVFSAGKLALLVVAVAVAAEIGAVGLYAIWTAGIVASLVVLGRIYGRSGGEGRRRPDFATLRSLRRHAAAHHGFNLALRVPELSLPLVVLAVLSATENAGFYVAWMIAGLLFAVPISLSSVLYAVGSANREGLRERLRVSLAISAAVSALAVGVLLVAAGPILGVFGPTYADAAKGCLLLLALGSFPEIVRTHYVAIRRLDRTVAGALPVIWGGALLEVAGGALGAALGGSLAWVALGWLAAVCIEAIVMAPTVLGALGRNRSRRGGRALAVAGAAVALFAVTAMPAPAAEPRVALGAFVSDLWRDPTRLDDYSRRTATRPAIVLSYRDWASPLVDSEQLGEIRDRGAVPMITWEPHGGELGVSLDGIAAGRFDGYLRRSARAVAAWRTPVMVRFAHEMNGDWVPWGEGANGNTAAGYKAAWRHIVALFRAEGADNALWVWCPNETDDGRFPFVHLYPGDRWVDWVGLDGFNWGGEQEWRSFTEIFADSYEAMVGLTSKPIVIVETAANEEGGDKPAWIRSALASELPRFDRVRALIWFNADEYDEDWPVESSSESLAAYREAAAAPLYQTTAARLLGTPATLAGAAPTPDVPAGGFGAPSLLERIEAELRRNGALLAALIAGMLGAAVAAMLALRRLRSHRP